MPYLMGKSSVTGNIYTGKLPKDCHLELEENRVWEMEITEAQFKLLTKSAEIPIIMKGEKIFVYKVE